jgi:hypothetical protein
MTASHGCGGFFSGPRNPRRRARLDRLHRLTGARDKPPSVRSRSMTKGSPRQLRVGGVFRARGSAKAAGGGRQELCRPGTVTLLPSLFDPQPPPTYAGGGFSARIYRKRRVKRGRFDRRNPRARWLCNGQVSPTCRPCQHAHALFKHGMELSDRLDRLHRERLAEVDRLRAELARPWWRRLWGR